VHRGLQSSLQWDRGLQSSLQWEREREWGRERGRERKLVRRCSVGVQAMRAILLLGELAVLAKLLEVALPDSVGRCAVACRRSR